MVRGLVARSIFFVTFATSALAQDKPGPPQAISQGTEFPVVFDQSVSAGKTPVGAKVQAHLFISTLFRGVVIPRNALLTGEVTESLAKKGTEPSRLAVRFDSARWKNGSAALKLYVTSSYYPNVSDPGQELQYGPTKSPSSTWNGQGPYPDEHTKVYEPFPAGDSGQKDASPSASNSITLNRRVTMKNVDLDRKPDGSLALVSHHSNIKLENMTTYTLVAIDEANGN